MKTLPTFLQTKVLSAAVALFIGGATTLYWAEPCPEKIQAVLTVKLGVIQRVEDLASAKNKITNLHNFVSHLNMLIKHKFATVFLDDFNTQSQTV